jgi:hypothetical protein
MDFLRFHQRLTYIFLPCFNGFVDIDNYQQFLG